MRVTVALVLALALCLACGGKAIIDADNGSAGSGGADNGHSDGGGCMTCSESLYSELPSGQLCPTSATKFQALVTCICSLALSNCETSCANTCSHGVEPDSTCLDCIENSCETQLLACQLD